MVFVQVIYLSPGFQIRTILKKLIIGLFSAFASSAFALTCELPAWSGEFVNLPPGQAPSPSYPVNPLPDSKAGDPCTIIESLGRVSVWGEPFDRYRYEYAYFKEGPKCMNDGPTQWTFFAGWGYSNTDSEGNEVPGSNPGAAPDQYCDGMCLHQIKPAAESVQGCTINQQPDGQFYKYECTYNYTAIKQATCTVENSPEETDKPTSHPNDPDYCPPGQDAGLVNGVHTCVPGGDGDGDTGGGDGDGSGDSGDGEGGGDSGGGDGSGDSGDGEGDSDTGGGDGPGGTDDPTAEDCPAGSDLLKCMTLGGVPGADGISKLTRSLSFMPDNVLGTTASCPADKTINLLGQTITITNMAQACNLLKSYVRPMALLLAFFSAIFVVSGVSNRTD